MSIVWQYIGFHLSDGTNERRRRRRQNGVPPPRKVDVADERGRERAEHDVSGELLRNHAVDADRRAKPRVDKGRRIVDEVVCRHDLKLPERAAKPAGEKLLHHPLARADERNPSRVLRRDALLRGKRRIRSDGKAPMVRVGQRQVVESVITSGPDEHTEVEGTVPEAGDDVVTVPGGYGKAQFRVRAVKFLRRACHEAERRRFARADGDGADKFAQPGKLMCAKGADPRRLYLMQTGGSQLVATVADELANAGGSQLVATVADELADGTSSVPPVAANL